jgi:oligosaccharide repeat unit polymerase
MGALRFMQSRGLSFQDYRANTTTAQIFAPVMASSNFLAVGKTAMLIDKVPQYYPHTYGSTYGLWLIAPIPRALWPEKPIVRIGGVLGAAIFGSDQRSGIPPGAVGEAFLNFGWIGIPFVLFFLGCILKIFYNTFGRYAYTNVNYSIIYSSAVVFVAFSGISADFTALMSNGLQRIVPLLVILWLITRKARVQKEA